MAKGRVVVDELRCKGCTLCTTACRAAWAGWCVWRGPQAVRAPAVFGRIVYFDGGTKSSRLGAFGPRPPRAVALDETQ